MKLCQGCFNELNDMLDVCPFCGYTEGIYSENGIYLVHGTVLSGRYIIGNTVSSDGISVTYTAWDNNSNIKVNIREFFPDEYVTRSSSAVIPLNEDCKTCFETGFSNFVEEAKLLFSGNGNVRLYDCIAENNTAYMILETTESIPVPAVGVQTNEITEQVEQALGHGPKNEKRSFPLWAKILIPSASVIVIVSAAVGIANACGVFNHNEDDFIVSMESEETSDTEILSVETLHEDGWDEDGDDRYFYHDGNMVKGWLTIKEYVYYFDLDTGAMTTGWREIDGKKYLFADTGEMIKGWQEFDGLVYFFDENSGEMKTGWIEDKDGKYFINPEDNKLVTGWKQIEESWYFFDTSGAMKTGWMDFDDSWYYFDDTGKMVTDIIWIEGEKYYFDSDGIWIEEPVQIVDAYNETIGYYGQVVYYSYPQISIYGKDMSYVNDTIYDDTLTFAESGLDGISYTYFMDDDIISICLEGASDMSYATFNVYNISVDTGEFISSSEFIEKQGLTDDQFFDIVEEAYDYYWESISGYFSDNSWDLYRERHLRNYDRISYEYVSPFLSPDGDLCFVSYDMMVLGGGDCDCTVINTTYPTNWIGRLWILEREE